MYPLEISNLKHIIKTGIMAKSLISEPSILKIIV